MSGPASASTRPNAEDWRRIRAASVFASLGDEDFRLIAGEPRCDARPEGQSLFFQDEPADAFFVVLDGWAVLSRDTSDGVRTVIKIVGPGESFAEALIAEGARYPVGAEAASPLLRVARFETARLRALVAANPGLGLSIVTATFRQMQRLVEQIEHLKSWTIERRVAAMLLQMCGDCPANGAADGCRFELPIGQTLIAARLAITPSTLSRTLKGMKALGVEARRGHIAIRERDRLTRFVAGQKPDGL
ncbi:Crp/Fnr family transcriptional regulator [Azospirillum agricola]|uniref:Crp/Fnr family transcriptional regulator n=1 Tax=Azospirillum agricola TaxID=1720247 RepID=UPI000A0F1E0D|nr:Crp/Fnr family transcriptional regulator [Azospirillum agricola]SMH36648.1 cAMP-binding domain of CRP or a regulatory subunit of cAMP-dependent protein kinases [Azospirillum lipoferum]